MAATSITRSNALLSMTSSLGPDVLTPAAMELEEALRRGDRKVQDWASLHRNFRVEFPQICVGQMMLDPFFNVNTPEELAQAAALIEKVF